MRLVLVLLLAALSSSAFAQAGDPTKGQEAFENLCTMCHAPDGGQGPKLAGVVGRRAGSGPDFPYTDALKASGLAWTPENLDRFLSGPGKLVPGTAMTVSVPDPEQRRDIIAYLATLK